MDVQACSVFVTLLLMCLGDIIPSCWTGARADWWQLWRTFSVCLHPWVLDGPAWHARTLYIQLTFHRTWYLQWLVQKMAQTQGVKDKDGTGNGEKDGIRQRLKKLKGGRLPLPSVLLLNVCSLHNKVDEMQQSVKYMREFRDASILAFTETWLDSIASSRDLAVDSFSDPQSPWQRQRLHRQRTQWWCVFLCQQALVQDRCSAWKLCMPDIELLSISLRPFYMRQEFPRCFLHLVIFIPKQMQPRQRNSSFLTLSTDWIQFLQMHLNLF